MCELLIYKFIEDYNLDLNDIDEILNEIKERINTIELECANSVIIKITKL